MRYRFATLVVAFIVALSPSLLAVTLKTTVLGVGNPSPSADARFGNVVASIADVNGDGVSDFAVGAPGADRVDVFSGATRLLIRQISDPENAPGNRFGFAVVAAGDVNGDGIGDIAVGAPGNNMIVPLPCILPPAECPPKPPSQGRVFLFSGANGSLIRKLVPPQPFDFLELGFALASPGDVSGDGISDLVVGAPTRLANKLSQIFAFSGANGSLLWVTAQPNQPLASFGSSLASIGDINSDGRRDLIVGEPFYTIGGSLVGRAHVLSSLDGSTIRTHDNPLGSAGKVFALTAAGIGDQNGDGREDYAISDPGLSIVYLFSGANGSVLGSIDSPAASSSDFFGFDLASSDDRDGDGKRDLWAGAPKSGKVYLVNGTGALLLTVNDPTAGPAADSLGFGWSLDATPDLGGDFRGDLLIGEPAQDSASGRAYVLLVAENKPPVANAGADQTLECTGATGTAVTLDGSASSDPDGDAITYTWRDSSNTVVGTSAIVNLTLPLGTYLFTLTVDDGFGGTSSDSVAVVVEDTTPPEITLSLSPSVLHPANHKLVTIDATIQTSDGCGAVSVTLVSITSNEPDNGSGDGDTDNDVQDAQFGSDDRQFRVRAERAGSGNGRIYTVTYAATDDSGNSTTTEATVVVPKGK
ncbi:MAG: PKD domain-containing protein [Acidobacteriota bacterium]